ncbi:hypothetical protein GXW78_24560 [Roseomonas terrae]|uniref:LCCL domain-containing protein n=1 Tax=Neoroseomonas terrae TaxID=424799 RepID=A0ABS5EPC9_9PROT|nr:hypothetical protein [Neoroseomonas terrae]
MKRLVLMLGLLVAPLAPAVAQPACPGDFEGQSAPVACRCTAEAARTGRVWGSGPYTTDSNVCRAAVHAGAIPGSGGMVIVTPVDGLIAYGGSTANGIATLDYGAWPASFTVATADGAAGLACPGDFQNHNAALSCLCSAEATTTGIVWGTGTYTTDSRICRAAVHAGVIPPGGGQVTVEPAPGLPSYDGSDANGVATSAYGPWPASFVFRRLQK